MLTLTPCSAKTHPIHKQETKTTVLFRAPVLDATVRSFAILSWSKDLAYSGGARRESPNITDIRTVFTPHSPLSATQRHKLG